MTTSQLSIEDIYGLTLIEHGNEHGNEHDEHGMQAAIGAFQSWVVGESRSLTGCILRDCSDSVKRDRHHDLDIETATTFQLEHLAPIVIAEMRGIFSREKSSTYA